MKKILFCVIALVGFANATQFLWGSNNGRWNTAANWQGGSVPSSTSDTVTFNNTGVGHCTLDVNISIGRLTITSGYTGHWVATSRTVTCATLFSDDGITGVRNYGNGITITGNGLLHANPTGTVTATSCVLTFSGTTDTLDSDKAIAYKLLAINGNLTLLNTSAGANVFAATSNTEYPLSIGNNGTFTNNATSTSFRVGNYNGGAPISLGTPYTLNGSGGMFFQFNSSVNGRKMTVPKMFYTGTGTITFNQTGSSNNLDTFLFSDTISLGGTLTITNNSTTNHNSYNFQNTIQCKAFNYGSSSATGKTYIDFNGINIFTDGISTEISTGANVIRRSTSTWYHRGGNYTQAAPAAGDTLDCGTSKQYFYGGTAFIVSTTNHTSAYYDVIDSMDAGIKLTLGDSLKCLNDFVIKQGKFASTSYNLNIGRNFEWYGSDSINLGVTRITFPNNATLKQKNTGVRVTKGASIVASGNLTFDVDSSNFFYNLSMVDSKKAIITNLKAVRCSLYNAGDLDNDSVLSALPGSPCTLNIPNSSTVTGTYFKDVYSTNTIYDTVGGYNGGGNTNIVFDTLKITAASPLTGVTIGGYPCTLTVVHGRTSGGSILVGANAGTITSQTAGMIIFTVPAGTGTNKIYASNGNGMVDSSQTFTYTGGTVIITTHPQSATDTIGSIHTFTVAATGIGGLSYQWRRKLASGEWGDVGTNSASYETPILARVDTNSKYVCLITDDNGTVSSDTATLTVTLFPPIISYAASPAICSTGIAYQHTMTNTGGAANSVTFSGLVAGVTGASPSGTITVLASATAAKFGLQAIAENSSGADTAYDTITIVQGRPAVSYAVNPARYTPGRAITTNTMANAAGGALSSVTVSPALPAGLSLNATTGAITGTPTTKQAAMFYQVIATNSVGADTVVLSIKIGGLSGARSAYRDTPKQAFRAVLWPAWR